MARSPAENKKLKELGISVRNARTRAGLTQEQLAENADLNTRTVQKIEAGRLNILVTTLAKIQSAIGCSWSALLGPEAKRRTL